MTPPFTLAPRRAPRRSGLAVVLFFAFGFAAPVSAADEERFPEIRLAYRDLALDTPAGLRALVERVDLTAAAHCARYGSLIVPYERRGQTRYCIYAVRAEMLRAMPRPLRTAYDLGRRNLPR
ncbi:UrcA family protein [Brevundimonas sp.]|uniref:UrcA family protein n=1 Tax=Brevundimonas sp. TaxID=1871086 RepID=UPI003F7010F3